VSGRPSEYGAHLRDVLAAQRERVIQAVLEDAPHFAPLHRDERVSLLRYNDESPQRVAAALGVGAGLLDGLLGVLTQEQLARPCVYDLPEPTPVDVGWVFVHTAHEVHHHLMDIESGLSGPHVRAG
jgi:DinB superfamily